MKKKNIRNYLSSEFKGGPGIVKKLSTAGGCKALIITIEMSALLKIEDYVRITLDGDCVILSRPTDGEIREIKIQRQRKLERQKRKRALQAEAEENGLTLFKGKKKVAKEVRIGLDTRVEESMKDYVDDGEDLI